MASPSVRIRVMGKDIMPAQVDGPADVYDSSKFIFVKPRWVGDEEVSVCVLCNNKFNQLRRKHHCRMCGRVLCNKCCKEKIALPQLGVDEPERVCEGCRPVTELVTKTYSPIAKFQQEAARGLAEQIKNLDTIVKVVEYGGLQTLIAMAKLEQASVDVPEAVASGLHGLSTHPPLHTLLADAGAIKALCSCISRAQEHQVQLLVDGISALMLFCKSPQLKTRAIHDGALQPVLGLCSCTDEAVSLLAVSTLSLIVEHPGTHDAVIDNARNALPRILSLTASSDEQMQEVALKTLGHLSLGTDWHRHRIVQEDFSSGRSLKQAINSRPKNEQILCNAACLIANLATGTEDQPSLQELLDPLFSLFRTKDNNKELTLNIIRALANFAKHKQNSSRLLSQMPYIVSKCLKCEYLPTRLHGMRAVLHLLSHSSRSTIDELTRNGAAEFLETLVSTPALVDSLNHSLSKTVPERARPM